MRARCSGSTSQLAQPQHVESIGHEKHIQRERGMATMIGAIATSHGPLLSMPPELWHLRAGADLKNPSHWFQGRSYDYAALLEARAPGLRRRSPKHQSRNAMPLASEHSIRLPNASTP
jgi:hypothetical protein